ncbi:polysaccharide deacetylase family protein [Streptomyces sp. NPDC060194]|uniref:polysaccharide deacetylase family protein n=1 Tax=Streptomyces sp. NPDC060194 TaxID=3347069 RepID=UPI00364B3E8A
MSTRTRRLVDAIFPVPRAPLWIGMYHSIGDPADDPYRVTVSPTRFERQLRWLRDQGLRGVSMRELLAAHAAGAARDLVGLTFDDGYRDFETTALPLLRAYDCTATVFVLPGLLGRDNVWDAEGPRKPLLDAAGIRRIADAGIEVGSHGLHHVSLPDADDAALRAETAESREAVAALSGEEVTGFCYPYGHLDARCVRAVRDAGYTYACAVDPGGLSSLLALPRAHVDQRDSAMRLFGKHVLHGLRRSTPVGLTPARQTAGRS